MNSHSSAAGAALVVGIFQRPHIWLRVGSGVLLVKKRQAGVSAYAACRPASSTEGVLTTSARCDNLVAEPL